MNLPSRSPSWPGPARCPDTFREEALPNTQPCSCHPAGGGRSSRPPKSAHLGNSAKRRTSGCKYYVAFSSSVRAATPMSSGATEAVSPGRLGLATRTTKPCLLLPCSGRVPTATVANMYTALHRCRTLRPGWAVPHRPEWSSYGNIMLRIIGGAKSNLAKQSIHRPCFSFFGPTNT